jgi:hypothetical protein
LRQPVDGHARFRDLLARRLDAELTPDAAAALHEHLAACPRCRAVERDYRLQRQSLRGLPAIQPPRDLWARTSAALDRELAASSRRRPVDGRDGLTAPRSGSPALLLTSLASFVLAVVLVGTQLGAPPRGDDSASGRLALPTPIEIPAQALAVVSFAEGGVAVYQTRVSRVCPPPVVDCVEAEAGTRRVVPLPGDADSARSLAVNSRNDRFALLARDDDGGETVYALLVPDPATAAGPGEVDPGPTFPAATVRASASGAVDGTLTPVGSGGPREEATLAPTARPTPGSGGESETPTARPSDAASASSGPTTGAPTSASIEAYVSPRATVVAAAFQAILADVRTAGAPPAWSADGDTLAFSAMPADRSHGPDVYTWRVGDERATRITDDHRSYFASWSADTIVVSRIANGSDGDPAARTRVVVVDPKTGEERGVTADRIWLPAVDPTGRFAVVWRGELDTDGVTVTPRTGALHLVEWSLIDPFARRADGPRAGQGPGIPTAASTDETPMGPEATDERAGDASGSGAGGSGAGKAPGGAGPAGATDGPEVSEGPTGTKPPDGQDRDAEGEGDAGAEGDDEPEGTAETEAAAETEGTLDVDGTQETASPAPSEVPPSGSPPPSEPDGEPGATEAPAPFVGQAVEPARDELDDPVIDWEVRWADDGEAFGYWVAETPGAAWGTLTVLAVERGEGRIVRSGTLLGPTLARRAFGMGEDRIVWAAPADGSPEGELRVRTWGPRGPGTLRIRDTEVSEALPAF